MAVNTYKCNHLMPLHFNGLKASVWKTSDTIVAGLRHGAEQQNMLLQPCCMNEVMEAKYCQNDVESLCLREGILKKVLKLFNGEAFLLCGKFIQVYMQNNSAFLTYTYEVIY